MRWTVLLLFVASAVHVHLRGRVRHGVFRQLSDHSTFTAPLNCFCYLFSAVPTTPFVPAAYFPELAALKREWRTFRQEALALYAMQRIRPSDKVDDIGFNSFFRRGSEIRGISCYRIRCARGRAHSKQKPRRLAPAGLQSVQCD